MTENRLVVDHYPDSIPRSAFYRLTLNGEEADVLADQVGDFVTFAANGPVEVCVDVDDDEPLSAESIAVRPLSRDISARISDRRVCFTLATPRNVLVDINGRHPLFLMASEPDAAPPAKEDPRVQYFASGNIYDAGPIDLVSGGTLYIEGGAVVRGAIRADGVENIRIAGRGVLDNGYVPSDGAERRRSIVINRCRNVRVDGITVVRPNSWMTAMYECEDVKITNLHELGSGGGSDGIDIVASKHVHVSDCIIENGDDCVVIKAFPEQHQQPAPFSGDVDDVLVERCVFGNGLGGNAIEIGFELRTDLVKNITFRDCDVLHVHGHGAAMSIHNSDHAVVSDVLFENIRVEHHYDKLIDLRIVTSRWGVDQSRGHIRNITFRDIAVAQSRFNAGYTCTLIGGYDAEHPVENVVLDNIRINGKRVTDMDELDLFQRHASGIDLVAPPNA